MLDEGDIQIFRFFFGGGGGGVTRTGLRSTAL